MSTYVYLDDCWHLVIDDYYSYVTRCGFSCIPTELGAVMTTVPIGPLCHQCAPFIPESELNHG